MPPLFCHFVGTILDLHKSAMSRDAASVLVLLFLWLKRIHEVEDTRVKHFEYHGQKPCKEFVTKNREINISGKDFTFSITGASCQCIVQLIDQIPCFIE